MWANLISDLFTRQAEMAMMAHEKDKSAYLEMLDRRKKEEEGKNKRTPVRGFAP